MMLVLVLFLVILCMPDDSTLPAPLGWACIAATWPLVVDGYLLGDVHVPMPISFVFLAIGWIATGLFWSFVAEWMFIAAAKKKHPDTAPGLN
jgi:hypothetical protein